jgi:hypothetical protein
MYGQSEAGAAASAMVEEVIMAVIGILLYRWVKYDDGQLPFQAEHS